MDEEISGSNFAIVSFYVLPLIDVTTMQQNYRGCFRREEVYSHEATVQNHFIYALMRVGRIVGVSQHTLDATMKIQCIICRIRPERQDTIAPSYCAMDMCYNKLKYSDLFSIPM